MANLCLVIRVYNMYFIRLRYYDDIRMLALFNVFLN